MTRPDSRKCRPHEWDFSGPPGVPQHLFREGIWQTPTGPISAVPCKGCGVQVDLIWLVHNVLAEWRPQIEARVYGMLEGVTQTIDSLPALYEGQELEEAIERTLPEAIVKLTIDLLGFIGTDISLLLRKPPPPGPGPVK